MKNIAKHKKIANYILHSIFSAYVQNSGKKNALLYLLQLVLNHMSQAVRKCVFCHMRTKKAHPRSLISAFVVRCLDSIISLDSIAEISRL